MERACVTATQVSREFMSVPSRVLIESWGCYSALKKRTSGFMEDCEANPMRPMTIK